MKNVIVCKVCQSENPIYQVTCENCKTYLRDRIYNLDLWQTIGTLIESPIKGFTRIIQAEHKNFIIFILLLSSLKFYINTIFFFLINPNNFIQSFNVIRNYTIILIATLMIIILFTYLIKSAAKLQNMITRAKDISSILIYALLPNIFGLVAIFPLELIFFGEYLFSNNPSPFLIKKTAAYVYLTLEILAVLWTGFLAVMALFSLTRNKTFSLSVGILFIISLFFFQYFISTFILKN